MRKLRHKVAEGLAHSQTTSELQSQTLTPASTLILLKWIVSQGIGNWLPPLPLLLVVNWVSSVALTTLFRSGVTDLHMHLPALGGYKVLPAVFITFSSSRYPMQSPIYVGEQHMVQKKTRQKGFETFSLAGKYCPMVFCNAVCLPLRTFSDMTIKSTEEDGTMLGCHHAWFYY